jgi:hypothetical protein
VGAILVNSAINPLPQIATILLSVGLLTTTASVSQMLRGSGMVFSALFAVWFLKRSLNRCALARVRDFSPVHAYAFGHASIFLTSVAGAQNPADCNSLLGCTPSCLGARSLALCRV